MRYTPLVINQEYQLALSNHLVKTKLRTDILTKNLITHSNLVWRRTRLQYAPWLSIVQSRVWLNVCKRHLQLVIHARGAKRPAAAPASAANKHFIAEANLFCFSTSQLH